MGTWGSGLYANDTSCDVRDTYIGCLQNGLGDQEAYEKTLLEMGECLEDEEEAPLFWYALAETQWKVGRLMPEVKEKALDWIEKGGGLSLWQESSTKGSGWQKTLDKLKVKLNSPVPRRKAVRKPKVVDQNLWNINDLYAYRFPEGKPECADIAGKYIVLQKIGEDTDFTPGKKMRIHAYNKLFDQLPTINDLQNVCLLPMDKLARLNNPEKPPRHPELVMNALMYLNRKADYPEAQLTFIGNQEGLPNTTPLHYSCYLFGWDSIYTWLADYYHDWHNVEYENLGNGTYRYIDKK